MEIKIANSQEFGRLLDALVDEMVSACIHFRLYSDLEADRTGYASELIQSWTFWSLTFQVDMGDGHRKISNLT